MLKKQSPKSFQGSPSEFAALVALSASSGFLQHAITSNSAEAGILVHYGLKTSKAVLDAPLWLWEQRERVKIALRSFVMLSQQSGVFNQATKGDDVREAFDNHACDDCSKMRHYKGEFKDWILFLRTKNSFSIMASVASLFLENRQQPC